CCRLATPKLCSFTSMRLQPKSLRALTLFSSSIKPGGMAPRPSRFQTTSRSCSFRRAHPNSTAKKISGNSCGEADFGTGGKYPRFDITPESDEQLACHGHNGDPPRASSQGADALAEPFCELASGLVAKPEPCELDHGRPCTRVPSPANAP